MIDGLDKQLFLLIYRLPHDFFLITFFSLVSAVGTLGFIWIVAAFLLVWFWKKTGFTQRDFFIFLAAMIIQTFVVEILLKLPIGRLRPFESLYDVSYFGFQSPRVFSFPSEHAANAFLGAFYLGGKVKKVRTVLFLSALLISFSRIYLGAHYVSDIVAGGVIGFITAKIFLADLFWRGVRKKWMTIKLG